MLRRPYTFTVEPRGILYEELLDLGAVYCNQALLVIRESCALSKNAQKTLQRLHRFEAARERRSEWPGTELHGGEALVLFYRLNEDSISEFKKASNALFSWKQPELPEDLCLLRSDGSPWLVTIAHEQDAYLELSEDEYARVVRSLPSLENALRAT